MTKLKPRTVVVTLYQGDDQERMDDLDRRIRLAEKDLERRQRTGEVATLDEAESLPDLREELREVAEQAEPEAVKVRLRALGHKRWHSLLEEHPPRPDREDDKQVGVNEDTFAEALVRACLLEPTFDTPADRDEFLGELSFAQFENLYVHAFTLNRSLGAQAPKGTSSQRSRS